MCVQAGHIYTYVGSILIAVNPFKFYPIYNPKYVKLYQNKRLGELAPHVFAIADAAYNAMMRDRKPQCIVISGQFNSLISFFDLLLELIVLPFVLICICICLRLLTCLFFTSRNNVKSRKSATNWELNFQKGIRNSGRRCHLFPAINALFIF